MDRTTTWIYCISRAEISFTKDSEIVYPCRSMFNYNEMILTIIKNQLVFCTDDGTIHSFPIITQNEIKSTDEATSIERPETNATQIPRIVYTVLNSLHMRQIPLMQIIFSVSNHQSNSNRNPFQKVRDNADHLTRHTPANENLSVVALCASGAIFEVTVYPQQYEKFLFYH